MTQQFSDKVLQWFKQHGRTTLPWQQHMTPYRVWISEIMLQQTQVGTVIPYFERFMLRFPNVHALAQAPIDEVLHLWTGLGYYARGRNLHRSAQMIVAHHDGELPAEQTLLEQLPGIGRSTAGAILALGFGKRGVILDGNVKRVLARYHALDIWPGETVAHQQLWIWAEKVTPQQQTAAFGQAMMDLGAMVCKKAAPLCDICPLQSGCAAFQANAVLDYPVRKSRAALPKKSWYVLMLQNAKGHILLQQRPAQGIWGGLWSLPECTAPKALVTWCAAHLGCDVVDITRLTPIQHTFTHFKLTLNPICAQLSSRWLKKTNFTWYDPQKPQALGLAAPIRRLLENHHGPHDMVS